MDTYLDITEALAARLDDEGRKLLAARSGSTVYRVTWIGDAGSPREGFAGAGSAADAKVIVQAHEAGSGRSVAGVRARKWGTQETLAAWLRERS